MDPNTGAKVINSCGTKVWAGGVLDREWPLWPDPVASMLTRNICLSLERILSKSTWRKGEQRTRGIHRMQAMFIQEKSFQLVQTLKMSFRVAWRAHLVKIWLFKFWFQYFIPWWFHGIFFQWGETFFNVNGRRNERYLLRGTLRQAVWIIRDGCSTNFGIFSYLADVAVAFLDAVRPTRRVLDATVEIMSFSAFLEVSLGMGYYELDARWY